MYCFLSIQAYGRPSILSDVVSRPGLLRAFILEVRDFPLLSARLVIMLLFLVIPDEKLFPK